MDMPPIAARQDFEYRSLMQAEAFGDDGSWDTEHLHSADRFDVDLIEAAHGVADTEQSGTVTATIANVLALGRPAKVARVIVGPTSVVVRHQWSADGRGPRNVIATSRCTSIRT